MPKNRINFPETLPGAAKFSGDEALNDGVLLVRAFKEAAWISQPLIERAQSLASPYGRHRMNGSWILVAVGLIASRQGDIQPFHARSSLDFWHECGFDRKPCYSTTHARLTELEALHEEIAEAIGRMIRHSEIDPRIGRHVYIDGTEAETHSRYHHACADDEYCAWRREGETADQVNARVLGAIPVATAQKRRQAQDATGSEGEGDERAENVEALGSSARALYRVRTSKHTWLTHDPDAGFRSYASRGEGWHGYYVFRAVDDFTGLTLHGHVESNARTENSQYETLLGGVVRAMNPFEKRHDLEEEGLTISQALNGADIRLPEAIIGDRGFDYPFIHEMNTRLGITTVTPWRLFAADGRSEPTEITLNGHDGTPITIDRHGVIRCRYCGGPTKRLELRRARAENPRLIVRCTLPSAPDSPCQKTQSVPCELDWRMCGPIARNDDRYLALASRFQSERAHNIGRIRNRNGAKDPILRPKRLGRAWQQLLLDLGTLTDWLRAGLKHAWLDTTNQTFKGYPKHVEEKMKKAAADLAARVQKKADALRLERQTAGLDTCPPLPEQKPPPT